MADIPITGVPSTYRVPGQYAEILFAQGPSTAAAKAREVIFVMPKYATGTGAWLPNVTYRVRNEAEAIAGAGQGSPIHRAIRKFLRSNTSAKIWACPYLPSSGGAGLVTALLTVTWTTAPGATGVTTLTVCGEPCSYGFKSTDTVTTIAAGVKAAVNAKPWLPVTADNVAGVLTFTAKIAGASQNAHIRVRAYIDPGCTTTVATQNSSDVDSLGSGAATAGVDGTTTEATNLTTALATLASKRYYYMCMSLTDTTSIGLLKTHISTKSEPLTGLRSVGICAAVGTLAATATIANAKNYERLWMVWQPNSEATIEELVGNYAAILQKRQQTDSAYNFDFYAEPDWTIPGVYRDADVISGADLNDAILDGYSPVQTTNSGGSYLVMATTTRSKDAAGTNDDFRVTEAHRVSVADEYTDTVLLRHALQYRGKKLTGDQLLADGTVNFNQKLYPGVLTPSTYKPFISGILDQFEGPKLQNVAASKTSLRVVRDPNNGGRLEVGHDLNVVDLFHQMTLRVAEVSTG